MIFDIGQRLALTIIREEANLIKPDAGQGECAIAAFAFDLTLIQAHCLNDPLKEQFDGLFAIAVLVVLFPKKSRIFVTQHY
jgi:hypothetical protein